jgi:hypothetical protein
MDALTRWRLAKPFIVLSGLLLFATALGAWAYWSRWSLAERLITIFLGIMSTMTLAVSISIGADRRISDVPWLRMGIIVIFFALAFGVAWARDKV